MNQQDKAIVDNIYLQYYTIYDGDIQGCCLIIADEIIKAIGGVPVAGFLCMC